MDADEGARQCCRFCFRPNDPRGRDGPWQHNDGCPKKGDDPATMDEWRRGHAYGFADNAIQSWQYRYYSKTFLFGFRAGRAEIESMVGDIMDAR